MDHKILYKWTIQQEKLKTYTKNLTLAENFNAWCLSTSHVSSYENTHKATVKYKRYRRRNHKTMPSSPDQTISCGHAYLSCISPSRHSVSVGYLFIDLL